MEEGQDMMFCLRRNDFSTRITQTDTIRAEIVYFKISVFICVIPPEWPSQAGVATLLSEAKLCGF
jgi:hypothetical protein